MVGAVLQLYKLQQRFHALFDFIFAKPLNFQRKGNVVKNGAAGKQVKMLKNHADILAGFAQLRFRHGGKFFAVYKNLPGGRHFQHVNAADKRGFACA